MYFHYRTQYSSWKQRKKKQRKWKEEKENYHNFVLEREQKEKEKKRAIVRVHTLYLNWIYNIYNYLWLKTKEISGLSRCHLVLMIWVLMMLLRAVPLISVWVCRLLCIFLMRHLIRFTSMNCHYGHSLLYKIDTRYENMNYFKVIYSFFVFPQQKVFEISLTNRIVT